MRAKIWKKHGIDGFICLKNTCELSKNGEIQIRRVLLDKMHLIDDHLATNFVTTLKDKSMKARLFILSFIIFHSSTAIVSQTIDRGFIHPGGLHTQADFERVKAQLAEGNAAVKAAYAKLTSSEYAQSSVQTNPVETIVRGGSGENYMNAARAATAAYQNALRWKISGAKANANAAVRILMEWARTTKAISGDSNSFLASGLYGYQFAQAAELMRDYDGWSRDDFEEYKQWMLTLWYPKAVDFLHRRNGSWENADKWWRAPGHYWSNWSLANLLAVISIGILCDDVYIYNQGMSFFKYDQCGTYVNPPALHDMSRDEFAGKVIWNDGLTDFLGNFVVTCVESELETGAYGHIGQMNESGRDVGHCALALGLAVDIAKVGWNQGDDLFAYMNHRLAAGIEYVAAQTQSVDGLPWTPYLYISSGYSYTDSRSWLMTEPAMGAQMRPYWGTVIGIYESVKGVRMPFAEKAYAEMGIDGGAQGSTSGGFDHLGYSVLMNTRDLQLCPPDKVPTELSPFMEYSGTLNTNLIPSLANEKTRGLVSGNTLRHNELGGLVNTYATNTKTCVPAGQSLRLMPQLPDGEEDTGKWRWNTGETTRDITVTTDRSFIYRVSYTNRNGIESQQCFSVATAGDCSPDRLTPTVTVGTDVINDSIVRVLYGKTATLKASPSARYGTWKWTGNKTAESLTTASLRKTTEYVVEYTNQGGALTTMTFHLDVLAAEPYANVGATRVALVEEGVFPVADSFLTLRSSLAVDAGSDVTLGLTLPSAVRASSVTWDTGATGNEYLVAGIQESRTCVATFSLAGEEVQMIFDILVKPVSATVLEPGQYLLRHASTDTYLTAHGKNQLVTFEPRNEDNASQLWYLECSSSATPKYGFISLDGEDSLKLATTAKLVATASPSFYIDQAVASARMAIHTGSTASTRKYWEVGPDAALNTAAATTLTAFPFLLIPGSEDVGVGSVNGDVANRRQTNRAENYDLSGCRVYKALRRSVVISNGQKIYHP